MATALRHAKLNATEKAYWQIRGRLELTAVDLGLVPLKNIAEPIRVFALDLGEPAPPAPERDLAAEQGAFLEEEARGTSADQWTRRRLECDRCCAGDRPLSHLGLNRSR